MTVPQDLLQLIKEELEWAKEGPEVDRPVVWHCMNSWDDLTIKDLDQPDATAFRVDGELYFGDDLEKLREPDFFIRRNPRHVVIRLVNSEAGPRKSFVLIRGDIFPDDQSDLNAVAYL